VFVFAPILLFICCLSTCSLFSTSQMPTLEGPLGSDHDIMTWSHVPLSELFPFLPFGTILCVFHIEATWWWKSESSIDLKVQLDFCSHLVPLSGLQSSLLFKIMNFSTLQALIIICLQYYEYLRIFPHKFLSSWMDFNIWHLSIQTCLKNALKEHFIHGFLSIVLEKIVRNF
jgi:hypothetical protein